MSSFHASCSLDSPTSRLTIAFLPCSHMYFVSYLEVMNWLSSWSYFLWWGGFSLVITRCSSGSMKSSILMLAFNDFTKASFRIDFLQVFIDQLLNADCFCRCVSRCFQFGSSRKLNCRWYWSFLLFCFL